VLKHLYPEADIPVVQLSLNRDFTPQQHYNFAKQLSAFRQRNILIIGSGNMVHNLRLLDWRRINDENYGFDWAVSAAEKMHRYMDTENHPPLIDYKSQGTDFQLSIPTPEHYLPLLYVLALKSEDEKIDFFNQGFVGGSLVMTSLKIG
ncbi:MAG: class III extradiol ring-cleavage dioxygenase, partial [Bacteroidia bacterium]|nr:class III extradiol ring-cleavage dioxygenase [Bacteroidia bacterium]